MRLSDAEKVSRADLLDLLLLETKYGTRGIFAEDLAKSMLSLAGKDSEDDGSAKKAYFEMLDGVANVELRRNTFRGKYLGNEVTDEQYAAIADGSFKGFFLGDYWRINGYTWRIADFDYWWDRHILLFPDIPLFKAKLFETENISSGFMGSSFFNQSADSNGKTVLEKITSIITDAFNFNHLMTITNYHSNSIVNGSINGVVATFTKAVIPKETMIFGNRNFSIMSSPTSFTRNFSFMTQQLSLLRNRPDYIKFNKDICEGFWLDDVANNTSFARVRYDGTSSFISVTQEEGIRPIIGLF